ncbi:hypothetical protein ACF1AB_39285 [Streptomyces sp. NPDC014846]|uniref:hypothetical protein n=1 Tax=Streptomyces sp. NPDC014846 TaxID=3364922 RepID=UPI0036F888CC
MTTMQNFGLTWTDVDGRARSSAVAYDEVSGERRKAALEASGNTDRPACPGQAWRAS